MFKYSLFTLIMFVGTVSATDPYKLTEAGDYEASEALLKDIKPDRATFPKYAFYRAVNSFALNNKTEAHKWATHVWDSFDEVPTRYKNTAGMMLYDLENWKEGDLGDIGRDMRMSGDRLKNARGDQKTQVIQKTIVDKLDRLIKEQEDKANAQANAGKDGKDGKPGSMPGQGQPAPDSTIMGGDGKGKIDEKKLRQVAENWGTMPPAQRAKVIQDITRELPPKYRVMIEEYFKALNRMPHK
jgi:hypothetical protein